MGNSNIPLSQKTIPAVYSVLWMASHLAIITGAIVVPMYGIPGAEALCEAAGCSDITSNPVEKEIKFSSPKKERQAENRGWTSDSLNNVLNNPAETKPASNWGNDNPATVYYDPDGNYVIVDDVTGEIIQVSEVGDPDWEDNSGMAPPGTH